MRIYLLRFADRPALTMAFARVAEEAEVGSCVIDSHDLRLRFTAPAPCADGLVGAIYADGGLTWTSRHDVELRSGQFGNPPSKRA